MRITRSLLPLLCGFFCSYSALAQSSYKPGYVVLPAGDTLRGQVQARGELRNSTMCRFRPNSTAAAVDYAPSGLRGYGQTTGPYYETRLIILPDSAGRQPRRLFFLELLEGGKASLYTRRDAYDDMRYYLYMARDGAGPAQELVNRMFRRSTAQNEPVQYEPIYRKTLSEAFRDCFSVQPMLPKLDYSPKSLGKVVRLYNACSPLEKGQPAARQGAVKKESQVSFGAVAGAANTEMPFSGNISLHNGTFKSSATPTLGLFTTLTLPALNEKLEFRADALYQKLEYSDSYVARDISSVNVNEQVQLQFHQLLLPLQLRYYFLRGNLRPFLSAGVVGGFLLGETRQIRADYIAGGVTVVSYPQRIPDFAIRKFDLGFLAGAGLATSVIKGHPLGLEVRAQRSGGYIQISSFGAPIYQVLALLSYTLF